MELAPSPAVTASRSRQRHGWARAAPTALFALLLPGCAFVGSQSLSNGRGTYNEVINATEDEQVLSLIVSRRYDETFGMLAVSSVTASLRISATVGANVGIGADSGYAGNLVPFSAGAAYEENPTISYAPLRGETFVERLLAPVSADQTLLLNRMSTPSLEVLRLLLRRVNGLPNPLYSSRPAAAGFDRFIELHAQLRESGMLDFVRTGEGDFEVLLHDYAGEEAERVDELLGLLGLGTRAAPGAPIRIPLVFGVGARGADSIDFETPSALEVIEAVAMGVEVPEAHLSEGLAAPAESGAARAPIEIHSSRRRPGHASAAVRRDGWWFFVDARDTPSKQSFVIVRTLLGIRLDESIPGQSVPMLTVPVSR